MNNILFTSDFTPIADNDNYPIILPPIKDKFDLFKVYNEQAMFPYFGNNWDSLSELIEDFHWIQQFNIRIYHDGVTYLKDEDLVIYLRIMNNACEWWKRFPKHKLSRLYDWLKSEPNLDFSHIWEWWKSNSEHRLILYFNKDDEERMSNLVRFL